MSQLSFSTNEMEAQLAAALRAVRPSGEFVQTVRQKMSSRPAVQIAAGRPASHNLLVILGGTLFASLLILTLARAVFYFLRRAKS